jgi:hypothetical protein
LATDGIGDSNSDSTSCSQRYWKAAGIADDEAKLFGMSSTGRVTPRLKLQLPTSEEAKSRIRAFGISLEPTPRDLVDDRGVDETAGSRTLQLYSPKSTRDFSARDNQSETPREHALDGALAMSSAVTRDIVFKAAESNRIYLPTIGILRHAATPCTRVSEWPKPDAKDRLATVQQIYDKQKAQGSRPWLPGSRPWQRQIAASSAASASTPARTADPLSRTLLKKIGSGAGTQFTCFTSTSVHYKY